MESHRLSRQPFSPGGHLVHADPALVAPQQHVVQDTIGHLSVRLDRDEVADRSVTLLGLASFTDLAQLLEHANWIVDQKVCRAVLMSGIRQRSEEEDTTADQVILNEHGQVMPNWVATNNLFDRRSTSQLFASMQRNHILSIVTRQASYATSVPVELVDTLTVLGIHNPAAQFAGRLAGTLLQRLWQGILSGRVGRSREWFQNVFYTDGRDPFVGRELTLGQLALQPMIRLVDRLVPYDVLPLLGSIDARIATQFFAPVTVMEKGNARCDVVGLSSVSTGLREVQPVPLADLVSALVKWPILKILDVLNVDR